MKFVSRDQALSSASNRFYDCIAPAGTVIVDCQSWNVIYLIACNK